MGLGVFPELRSEGVYMPLCFSVHVCDEESHVNFIMIVMWVDRTLQSGFCNEYVLVRFVHYL